MTILEALVKWSGASSSLENLLRSPYLPSDLKLVADEWLAKLAQAVTVDNLASVALALPGEARDILRGKLAPKDHPSDFA